MLQVIEISGADFDMKFFLDFSLGRIGKRLIEYIGSVSSKEESSNSSGNG